MLPIKRFELYWLRPMWLMVLLVTVVAGIKMRWSWLAGGIASLMYFGYIGAKLHPSLSGAELAEGPLKGGPALKELVSLTLVDQSILVAHACNRFAHFLFFALFAVAFIVYQLKWYWSVPVAFVGSALLGGCLRVAFSERKS